MSKVVTRKEKNQQCKGSKYVEAKLQESKQESKEDIRAAHALFVAEPRSVADRYSAWAAPTEITYDAPANAAGIAPVSRAVTIRL
jgi:hypothetical protein